MLAVVAALALPAEAEREQGWELSVPERIELTAGSGGTLSLALEIDRGLTISKDAALILDLAPDPAVVIKRHRIGRDDAVNPDADAPRFAIPVRVEAVGDYTVKLHLRFWLCGRKTCRPIDTRRAVAVAVVAPAAPAPPPADAGVAPDAVRHRGR
jgi:hypothetical protein